MKRHDYASGLAEACRPHSPAARAAGGGPPARRHHRHQFKYSGASFLENVNNIDFAIQDMKGFEICRADPSAYLWWMKRVDRLEGLDEIYSEFVEYPAEFQLFHAFDHRFCDRYPDLTVRIASEAHTKAGPLLGPTD